MKTSLLLAAAVAALTGQAAAATAYLPSGPQQNVALSTVTGGGWSLCYSAPMGAPFGGDASALAGCGGGKLMLAGRETGSDTLLVLAQADRDDVLFDTGVNEDVTHEANGTAWYYSPQFSLGFAPVGEGVSKNECDTAGGDGRLCIHTFDWVGGYRINDITGLNDSQDYEKLAFSFNGGGGGGVGGVPEPASWALMITGFGLVGAGVRGRRAAGVAVA